MADEQNLELPKLFRRRRKEAASDEAATPEDRGAPEPTHSSVEPTAAPAEGAPEPAPEPAPTSAPAQPAPAADRATSVRPAEPAPEPVRPEAARAAEPVAPREQTRVLADGPPPPVAVRESEEPAHDPAPSERGPRLTLPQMPGALAAALTGLIVGVVSVALVLGAGLGCRAVGGTSSCGGGPGTLILLGILALAVVLGTILLRACGVAEGLSVSALAVGLVGVAVMLFLLEVVFSAWMILVIPLLTIAAFALAWWVTVRLAAEAAHDLD